MERQIPWSRRLSTKLGMILFLVATLATVILLTNIYMLRAIRQESAAMRLTARGPAMIYETLYLLDEARLRSGDSRAQVIRRLEAVMAAMEERFEALREGDAGRGVAPLTDPILLADLEQRERQWRTEIRPLVRSALEQTDAATVARVEEVGRDLIAKAEQSVDLTRAHEAQRLEWFRRLQLVLLAVIAIALVVAFVLSRRIAGHAQGLAETADRIAAGDLDVTAPQSGAGELAVVADAFNRMTVRLRSMIEEEKQRRAALQQLVDAAADTINSVTTASAEILAATTQQAAGAQEQASAVTETVSTVDEVLQTSEQAAQRARAVADSARRSADLSSEGRNSVEQAINIIGVVNDESRALARDILALAEQAQAIGEIISSVSDIAEQTNILALNAAIEASRAGEHGKGFAVVAAEVKALSAQSKKATAQVRQILGQIQKATNTAVFATEKTGSSITQAVNVVHQSGETIAELAELIEHATTAAAQIAASSTQQVTGMSQIHQAMKNIREVTHQNLASTRQSEVAAQDLNRMAGRLKELLQSYS